MVVAKVNKFSKLSPLLTFYKLKVLVTQRGSYGGFHKNEIKNFAEILSINRYTLLNHIKYLLSNGLLQRDLTNKDHFRVKRILDTGYNIAGIVENKVLLSWNIKDFKSFALELATENLIKKLEYHSRRVLRKNKGNLSQLTDTQRTYVNSRKGPCELNGVLKGSQLSQSQKPISCRYQGLKLDINKSTVSRWRKQRTDLYFNRIEVTTFPPDAIPHLLNLKQSLPDKGQFFISKEGKVCYRYIGIRTNTNISRRVRRKKERSL